MMQKVILAVIILLLSATLAHAAGVPTIISYQGRLTDSSNNLLGGSGTTFYFKFSIWDNATVGSGARQWPTALPGTVTTTVRDGIFNVDIGDTAGSYPDVLDYDFNTLQDIFLQVEVSSDNVTFQTLAPRQRIAASAFSELAGAVSGASRPSSFGTTTPLGDSVVTIEATSTIAVPLSIRSSLGQIANILQVQNSLGTNLFSINSSGGLFASSTLQVTGDTNLYGNLIIGGTTQFGGVTYTWPASDGSAGYVLSTNAGGGLSWKLDAVGSGGSGLFSTTSDNLAIHPVDTAHTLIIGSNATSTTGNILEVIGSALFRNALIAYDTITAPIFNATNTAATSTFSGGLNVLAINQTGSATSTFTQGIDLGAGCFSVNGTCVGGSSVSVFDDLTNVDTSGVLFGNVVTYDGANWVDTATSTLNIALSNTTGTLAVNRGGTGSTSPSNFLFGDGAGGLTSTSTIAQNFIDGALARTINVLTLTDWYATTTDQLTEGTTNKYYSTLLFSTERRIKQQILHG